MLKSRRPNGSPDLWVQGDAEVESERPDRRIITNPWPDADTQIAQIIAWRSTVDIASIDEHHAAEVAADREAQLNAPDQQAVAAKGSPFVVQWADPIRGIAANAARPAREKAHVGRHAVATTIGFDTPDGETGGQDQLLPDGVVMARF